MKILVNEDIQGFKTTSPVVNITKGIAKENNVPILKDGKKIGLPFYYRDNNRKILEFNLPKGIYELEEGTIFPIDKPVQYDFVNKYVPDFNPSTIPKLKIVVKPNPNKCSVNIENVVVDGVPPMTAVLDPSFVDKPDFIIKYVMGHEYGHFYYRGKGQDSEKACDAFSIYFMLKVLGFNPSQCLCAIEHSLSHRDEAEVRKDDIYKELLKYN
jgi:hypothetical protein